MYHLTKAQYVAFLRQWELWERWQEAERKGRPIATDRSLLHRLLEHIRKEMQDE